NSRHYYQDQEITFQDGSKRILGGDFYSTDQYTDWAIDFLEGKDGRETGPEKPWYLWLCYGAVHGPFTPAPRHVGAYASAKVPVPSDIFPPRAGKPAWANLIDSFGSDPESGPMQTFAKDVQQYHEGVLALDEAVGRLLTALDQTGQRENTLVVFTSDQGFAWGQHGFRARKVAPYDANIRVPLIISQPGSVPENEVCLAPVGGVDLVSTFFAQAGLEAPWPLHGTDLTPLLEEPSREWNQPTLISFQFDQYGSDTADLSKAEGYRKNGVPWYAWVRMGDLKYVLPLDASEEAELYHLRKDPEELTNLVNHPEYQEKRKELHAQLLAELRRTEAPFIDQL
ncbi:MAG: sulfatase-like hydrolase/transferase, partial [Verrucomicrobiota bacterium]